MYAIFYNSDDNVDCIQVNVHGPRLTSRLIFLQSFFFRIIQTLISGREMHESFIVATSEIISM